MKLVLFLILLSFNDLALSSEEQVEIHASLCPSSQSELLIQLERASGLIKQRNIWYLDHPDLSLNNSGKILRIRKDIDKNKVTITVKLRTQDELKFAKPEIDCEKDWYGEEKKSSCSLDSSLPAHEWDLALQGKTSLITLFSSTQLHFLFDNNVYVNWNHLKIYGNIEARIWKYDDKTLEIWSMSNRDKHFEVYEVSTRAPIKDAQKVQEKLFKDLILRGVKLCSSHESKTKTVLEFLSKNHDFKGDQ